MKDPHLRLYHIRDAIERIEDYAASGESAFLAERMRQDAISRNMEIIGEAIRHLPVDLRASVPEIDWEVAGPHGGRRDNPPACGAVQQHVSFW